MLLKRTTREKTFTFLWSVPTKSSCSENEMLVECVSFREKGAFTSQLVSLSGVLNFLKNIKELTHTPLRAVFLQFWRFCACDITVINLPRPAFVLTVRTQFKTNRYFKLFPPSSLSNVKARTWPALVSTHRSKNQVDVKQCSTFDCSAAVTLCRVHSLLRAR